MRRPSYRLHKSTGQAVVTLGGKDHYLGKHGTPESQAYYRQVLEEYESTGKVTKLNRSITSDGPEYRLHKASGKAVVTLGGKDYYLGKHNSAKSRTEFYRLKAEFYASGCSASFRVAGNELLVSQLIVAFVRYCNEYYGTGPSSELLRYKPVLQVLRKLYGDTLAVEFGPLQYEAVRYSLTEPFEVRRKDGTRKIVRRSRSYINAQMKRLRSLFKWGTSKALIPVSILEALKTVEPLKYGRTEAPERQPVVSVSAEVVEATLPHLNHVVAAMVKLQQLCGARPGEVVRITPAMIDRTMEESKGVWLLRFDKHKTAYRGKKRIIPLGKQAQSVLLPFMLRGADDYCFSPAEATKRRLEERHSNRKTPMNCGNSPGTNIAKSPKKTPGDRYDTQSYGHSIRESCKKAGIEPWAPNRLRHAYCTVTSKAVGVELTSQMMGHSGTAITKVYIDEPGLDDAIEVARKLG